MKVVLSGFGAMGKVLLEEISMYQDIELVGVVDPLKEFGVPHFDELTQTPDVIIDFSHPDCLNDLLGYAINNNVNILIATTGYSQTQLNLIQKASEKIAILKTGNTSLGVNLIKEILKQITPVLHNFDIEIIEKHHNKKVDAPSGTANMFIDSIKESRSLNEVYGRQGVSKRKQDDITIHSVRGGTVVGEHSILYYGNDEIIEIKHQALSKRVFASGAIKASFFLLEKVTGLYEMKDSLKEVL